LAVIGLSLIHIFPVAIYFMSLPTAYITVYLGMMNPPKLWPLQTGDYSYGIFLYGSPIQQAVVATIPGAKGNWLIEYPVSLIFILAFAVLSWHCVEKHALAQKWRLYRLERRWLTAVASLRARLNIDTAATPAPIERTPQP
jgi:peptidoglycan/LPS O-acetylase OafA/YrhL